MKYKVGDKFYKYDKRSKHVEELEITEIYYKFNKTIKGKYNYDDSSLEELLKDGTLTDNQEAVKKKAIADIEAQFGIKLKEV